MAATKTLTQLRAMVRELADQETSAPTTAFVDNTELDDRINEALKQLYNLLIQSRGQEYYVTDWSFSTVADQRDYALPSDFFRLVSLHVSSGTQHLNVPTWEVHERPDLLWQEATGNINAGEYRYRLQATDVSILPTPSGTSHTFHMLYVPAMPELVSTSDYFDGVNGWEKWAALTAAMDLATKEENYELVQTLAAQRAVIQAQIEALAGERDAARPPRIQDTRRDGDRYPAGFWFEGWL